MAQKLLGSRLWVWNLNFSVASGHQLRITATAVDRIDTEPLLLLAIVLVIKYVINPGREMLMFTSLLFTMEDAEAQRALAACPQSHSREVQSPEPNPRGDRPLTTVHHLAGEAWGTPQVSRMGEICLGRVNKQH